MNDNELKFQKLEALVTDLARRVLALEKDSHAPVNLVPAMKSIVDEALQQIVNKKV